MFRRSLAAAAAAAALACASQSSAAVLVVQQTGVFTGMDVNNILGHGFGEVSDIAYSLSFTFDLDHADVRVDESYGGLIYTGVAQGGSNYGRPPLATIDLQIGDYGFTLLGGKDSTALQGGSGVIQQSFFNANDAYLSVGAQLDFWPGLLPDVTAPVAGNLCEIAACYATINLQNGVYGIASSVTSYTVTYDPEGTYTPPANTPVPEPATWALMIAGFGLAGASLRRRRAFA